MSSFRRSSATREARRGLALTLALATRSCRCGRRTGQEAPVVLALDSSRSLSAAESRATATLAKEILAGLPASTPAGVLVFDDEVRWLARPGAGGAARRERSSRLASLRRGSSRF